MHSPIFLADDAREIGECLAELKRVFIRFLRALDTKYRAAGLGVGASWLRRAKGDDPWLTCPETD